ncbi:MAG: hypothetical protein AMXMBFR84_35500 [Candidatus Hydrogenedentota bacterium]
MPSDNRKVTVKMVRMSPNPELTCNVGILFVEAKRIAYPLELLAYRLSKRM